MRKTDNIAQRCCNITTAQIICFCYHSGVSLNASSFGTICNVTSKSNEFVTIEVYAVNKNGNTIVNEKGNRIYDREGISSEVSLWWIILYCIRQMFSITNATLILF